MKYVKKFENYINMEIPQIDFDINDESPKNLIKYYNLIIDWIPKIKSIISMGGTWDDIKHICEPLYLSDTSFRENPTIDDFLLNIRYWKNEIKDLEDELFDKN